MKGKYYIVCVDWGMVEPLRPDGKCSRYGKGYKLFATKKAAEEWIERRSYRGMSFHYEVRKYEG